MYTTSPERKLDKELYKKELDKYIPVACYIDDRTLINKNGELIQIIKISGIDIDHPSENLKDLRNTIREAIKANIDENVAVWVHTIREKKDLDDPSTYPSLISANIHRIWRNKNYLHEKFVNTLYISLVHKGAKFNIYNLRGFIQSLFISGVYNFHNNFIKNANIILTKITDKIANSILAFRPRILKIKEINGTFVSEQISLYSTILAMQDKQYEVDIYNLSEVLSNHNFAVGNDKIEIISGNSKKFASIVSLKGNHDILNESLDLFIQSPVNMIITEIFYQVNKSKVLEEFKFQKDILELSKAKTLYELNGFDEMFDSNQEDHFYNQQITIKCITDKVEELNKAVSIVSENLSKLGLIHVKEDICLEQAYWSQIPGNFKFLKRTYPNIASNICLFASIYNTKMGMKYSKWGRAATILRAVNGAPYFFNFHDKSHNGHSLIVGQKKSGKTVLTNFLVSECTKYLPKILYFATQNSSNVFIPAIGGSLADFDKNSSIPNFFINYESTEKFLKLILLGEKEVGTYKEILDALAKYIVDNDNISIKEFLKTYEIKNPEEEEIKRRLKFLSRSEFQSFFFKTRNPDFTSKDVFAINLTDNSDSTFKKNNFPQNNKLLGEYEENLKFNKQFVNGLALSIIDNFVNSTEIEKPKIIIIDNLLQTLHSEMLTYKNLKLLLDNLSKKNCLLIANIDTKECLHLEKDLFTLFGTKCILATDITESKIKETFSLCDLEYENLKILSTNNRAFLLKQDDESILLELSLGGLPGIVKILSAGDSEIKLFKALVEKHGLESDEWIKELYVQYNQ
jgi:type IV secretion system protein VirB4